MNISLKQAQSYILNNQLLSGRSTYRGTEGTQAVIEKLGYIQIDTISVIARAHHHILYTRIPDYRPEYLEALEQKRKVFEYWAHAASYLPMKDFRYSLVFMEKVKAGVGHWRKRDKKWMQYVYDRIKAEGPKMGRDFTKDKTLQYDHAWGGHPVNQALRQLFMEGELMVTGRKGFQKVFDLTENVLPQDIDTRLPSEEDYYKYLILRDLRANGIMKAREFGHLITIPKKSQEKLLAELQESGEISKVQVKGTDGQVYYAIRESLENFKPRRRKKYIKILSPFDNLIIQRKRMIDLFNFNYTLECYVPSAKRKVGYFSLPLLRGTAFVGQIDLKADRKKKVLIVKNLVWQTPLKNKERIIPDLNVALTAFTKFNACNQIEGLDQFL